MSRLQRTVLATAALLALLPSPAAAHLVSTRFGDFYGGMLHPLFGLEYSLPWFALGLLAGLQRPRDGRWMLLAFPLGIAAGIGLALLAPSPERLLISLNLASFVVVGVLIAAALPLMRSLLIGIGSAVGMLHGWENALAIGDGTNAGLFVAGVVTISYVIIALITAATVQVISYGSGGRIAVRAVGSWITAIGLLASGVRLLSA